MLGSGIFASSLSAISSEIVGLFGDGAVATVRRSALVVLSGGAAASFTFAEDAPIGSTSIRISSGGTGYGRIAQSYPIDLLAETVSTTRGIDWSGDVTRIEVTPTTVDHFSGEAVSWDPQAETNYRCMVARERNEIHRATLYDAQRYDFHAEADKTPPNYEDLIVSITTGQGQIITVGRAITRVEYVGPSAVPAFYRVDAPDPGGARE